MTDMPSGEISSEPSGHAFPCESGNLTPLLVFRNGDPLITDFEPESDNIDPDHQDKIIVAALKLLTFRERHVLVQFWSPHELGKHRLLSTIDQPFGFGVIDAGLCSYRRDSERRSFVVEEENEEEDPSPATRVFRLGLPEWTSNLNNYTPKQFPQQECATRCKLHGYLALPVFDSNTQLCVGVLELLTSSRYTSFAYEVQQIHTALKAQNLTSPQGFDSPTLYVVPNERRQKDFDKMCGILKTMCDVHSLPLAQTWAVSQHTSYVSHEKDILKSCSSFDTRCVRKVCMSTAALPFHVQDLAMWPFLKACREQHLDVSCGFVGKAFISHGSCFCGDLTKLSEEEYPLVHHARMNRLSSCFAIFLRSVEANDDYVLEFFLPPDIKDSGQLLNLVQTLKQNIEIASGFQLGDSSCIQVVELPLVASKSLGINPHTVQIASITTTNNSQILTVTSDSESIRVYRDKEQCWPQDHFTLHDSRVVGPRENNKVISYPNVIPQMNDNITDAEEKHNRVKLDRKRKIDSLTMEAVEKHLGKTLNEACKSLGVSRSTLKRFCREHDIPRWPLPKHTSIPVCNTELIPSRKAWTKQNLQRHSSSGFSNLAFVVFLVVKFKRWSCSIKSHGFSGKWWSCGRHSYLPSKSDFMCQAARLIVQLRNKNSMKFAVSESTAKQTVADNTDIKMVTVKATYEEDTIKFQFPTSSGLLELEHEVARRIDLKGRKLRLRYKDEENDLITLGCEEDLPYLLGFTAKHSTIKLIVKAV